MYLNIEKMVEKSERVTETFELISLPGTKVTIKKLDITEYLLSQEDIRFMSRHFIAKNEKANEGKAEDDPTRAEEWCQLPSACVVRRALLNEKGDLYFAGKSMLDVYETLTKLPVDAYAEIATAVEELNPTTAEALQARRDKQLEEKKRLSEEATALEKSTG